MELKSRPSRINRFPILLGLLILACCLIPSQADDWPQWRGPNRDGIWRETGILESIPSSGLKSHHGAVQSLAFSTDGRRLATGSMDDLVLLWDTATWKEKVNLQKHRSAISSLAFSPDGRTLGSAGMDDAVHL